MENQNTAVTVNKRPLTAAEKLGVGALVLGTSAGAMAEGLDVTSIVTTITGAVATVSSIGLAVLTLYVTAKVFKWVKTAM